METALDVARVLVAAAAVIWFVDLARGRIPIRDERGRLRPGWAVATISVTIFLIANVAAIIFD